LTSGVTRRQVAAVLRTVPLRLPVPDGRALRRRAARIVAASVRALGPTLLRRALGRPQPVHVFARPLRALFEQLGVTFVKCGQLIASSPGVFGDAVADEFRSCLDTGPVVPADEVEAEIETDLGAPLAELFATFDPIPIGRASMAVVHRATLQDGRAVAVKVLRPGIETTIATDLRLMGPLLEILAFRVGIPEAGQLVRLLEGFREQLAEELDLRNEARAMAHHRRLLAALDLERLVVPEPFPSHSGRRVLTMELLDGVPIDDHAGVARLGVDPRPLLEQLVRAWFITALRDGTFHADAHAGNILVLRDGRVGVVDWGIVGRLDARTHRFLRRIVEGALGDATAWHDIATEFLGQYGPALSAGLGMDTAAFARFSQSIIEPMLTRPFGEVSLGQFLAAWQGKVDEAEGRPVAPLGWRGHLARLRRQRELHRGISRHGGRGTSFDRGTFLLAKQFLYFERYGKLFLSDTSLLADRAFFERLLHEGPLDESAADAKP
jgi:aarF domain-containing kinase